MEQFTALHYAACRGHLLVAERLIRAGGANVHAINKDGESPLHLAAYGGYLNIVELLLDSKANVHATNGYQETPLFYAARRGYGAVTRLLMYHCWMPHLRSAQHAAKPCIKTVSNEWLALKV